MERVLEACAELPSFSGELPVLRQRIAESAREIFQAVVAGMMVRDGETTKQQKSHRDERKTL